MNTFFWILFFLNKSVLICVGGIANKQCCDSFRWIAKGLIYVHVSLLPQTPLPSRLPRDIEQSSLGCAAGPCWFSMLNTAVCPCPSEAPWLSLPPSFPLVTIRLLQSVEQSSLGWPAGPCWLSLLNTAVRNTFFKKLNEELLHWIRRKDCLFLGSISGKVRQLEIIARRKKLALIRV